MVLRCIKAQEVGWISPQMAASWSLLVVTTPRKDQMTDGAVLQEMIAKRAGFLQPETISRPRRDLNVGYMRGLCGNYMAKPSIVVSVSFSIIPTYP